MPGGDFVSRRCAETDAEFPELLRGLARGPHVLYWSGTRWPPPARAVALVGSRAASPYGAEMAWRLAADLARAGVAVVSGMARGVDEAAHQGALEAGGETVAVLAASPSSAYPRSSRALHDAIRARGAACAEFPEGVTPKPALFLQRNRIVAGLAKGVVVVEAGSRSGALTTAAWAGRWGRFVAAVPGDVTREVAQGTLALLRRGAVPVGDAGHVLALLEDADGADVPARVLAALGARPATVKALASRARASEAETGAALVLLELAGSAQRHPGGRFARRQEPGEAFGS